MTLSLFITYAMRDLL